MGNPYKKIRMSKMRGLNYVAQTRACSKSVLGGLKQTELQRLKNRGKRKAEDKN